MFFLTFFQYDSVRFRLDETGDVTWTVSKEFETVPLFMCETYEIYSTTAMGLNICFGAYAGHVIKFKVSKYNHFSTK